jgi:hypothetical protein
LLACPCAFWLVWLVVVVVVVVSGALEASDADASDGAVVSDCTVVVVLLVSELALSVLLLLLQPLIAQARPSAMMVAKTVRCFIESPSSCGSDNGHARVMVPRGFAIAAAGCFAGRVQRHGARHGRANFRHFRGFKFWIDLQLVCVCLS